MVWDGPGDMELVRQVHEEELEPAFHHLLVVAGLTGVKQLPALGGGVLQVSAEVLGVGVKVSLDRDVVVFCLKALLTTSTTRILLRPLSSGSPIPCGIAVVPCVNAMILSVIALVPCRCNVVDSRCRHLRLHHHLQRRLLPLRQISLRGEHFDVLETRSPGSDHSGSHLGSH